MVPHLSPSFGAAMRAATPAPSCSGLSRTPRRPAGGAASAQRATQRHAPPATAAAAPHAPPRRATLSGGSADVAAGAVGPSAPSVSAGDVAGGAALRWAGGGDARVAAAAGSDSGCDPRGREGDAPLRAADEDWLARTPLPSSAGDAPAAPAPVPAPQPAQQPRGLEAAAVTATPARSSGGGDALMALLMRAVRSLLL